MTATTANDVAASKSEQIARGPITVSIMLATLMNALDTTIANVALPHIQGSVSASAEQDHLGPDLVHRRRGDHDADDRLAVGPHRS